VVPEDAVAVGQRFEKMRLNEAILGEWHMAIGLTEPFVTRWAHCADLVILGQRIPDHDTGLYWPEDVVLSCSRPVLVVPYAGRRPDRLGENVSELDVDLLVMGAYSHSRFREIILGRVTRDILRDMNLPVLMAH
jgi:hypothetical protein